MSDRTDALRYIRRVLGMQPSVRAQLALREQQVELLTAEIEELRSTSVEFTERQASAWPDAVAEAQRYVDTSTITPDIRSPNWRVVWQEETRPGRGHLFDGTWMDGEYVVQIRMDVYGYPTVSVAETAWVHSSSDEECPCAPCVAERARDDE